MEKIVALDTGGCVLAKEKGVVVAVDSTSVIIKSETPDGNFKLYNYDLTKFRKSNQDTCINQRVLVQIMIL